MASRRVVITGTGLVTPLGTGVAKTWKNICAGMSGIDRITRYDPTGDPVQIAGEVKDFIDEDHFDKKSANKLKLFVKYALVATHMALEESGLEINDENCGRVGVITGWPEAGLSRLFALSIRIRHSSCDSTAASEPQKQPMVEA